MDVPQEPCPPNLEQTPAKPTSATSTAPKTRVPPKIGEVITCNASGCTYTMGEKIGEGHFSDVFACTDQWENLLVAKVLKPLGSYDKVRENAVSEFLKLKALRNPFVTFVFDAFEFRDTFYIITERCRFPVGALLTTPNIDARGWIMPIARCVLQAVHYLHCERYVHQDIHAQNVFISTIRDELEPQNESRHAMQFKLGDLGVAMALDQISINNVRAQWMLPPEVLDEQSFGPIDHHVDIYHLGLLFLSLAYGKELRFSKEEILAGRPREMALQLPDPFRVALEKSLRRRVPYRTASAMELWRDLRTPA